MRLFAAVVPPPEVLEHLELALRAVDDGGRRGPLRWTEPADRHLTLAFYGDVPDGYLDEVTRALGDVAATTAPFRLALRGAGVFDGRTVWIGLAGGVAALQTLMRGAASVGTEVLQRDPRERSRAHVTVARVRSRSRRGRRPGERRPGGPRPGQRPAAWPNGGTHPTGLPGAAPGTGTEPADANALAHALAVYEGPAWTVTEIALMASDLGAGRGGAPRYDVVQRLPFAAVAG